jgi:beta-lactamase regulating signal transducer with metallopeptidase domain
MTAFTAQYLSRLEMWGLLVSLLQGILVFASWRAWQRTTADAAWRHWLACAHFAALGLLPLLTLAIVQVSVYEVAGQPPHGPPTVLPTAFDGVRANASMVVAAVWAAGVAVMLWRLSREARALARLRHAPAPAPLSAALRATVRARLVTVLPEIGEARIRSPQVAGWWRPRLLVPRGLSALLDAAELEAVLLHELAHVRRGDLRWNLLQRVVLSLLWFHPVAWALQAAIARERERCCDALAVRHGAHPAALARALVKLAEAGARPTLAMSMSHGGALVERVQDLLRPPQAGMALRRRSTWAAALSLTCVLALGAGRLVPTDGVLGELYLASAFGPMIAIQARDSAGSFALWVRQGRVIQASVRDRPVHISQQGGRVTLTDAARVPVLVLTVTPQDRVQWEARH